MSSPQRKPWLVYSSSPDRGLDVIFEMWPSIRKGAEAAGIKKPQLHFAYSPIYFQFKDSGAFPHLKAFHAKLERLETEAGEGLVNHGSLSQPELAKLFRESMIWSYPSWTIDQPFPEIYCLSAVEAQAGGCIPVCLDYGALKETVFAGDRLEPDEHVAQFPEWSPGSRSLSDSWRQQFTESCVKYLSDQAERSQQRKIAQPKALELDWSGVADDWQLRLLTPILHDTSADGPLSLRSR